MNTSPAPVSLFTYKRLEHTQRTVTSLLANPLAAATDLIVFADAPKQSTDATAVQQVLDYIASLRGFRSLKIVQRPHNLGVDNSIIQGVTAVLESYEQVIVMEDDLLVSPHFLDYMNAGLSLYAKDEQVISLHGYMYPLSVPVPDTFFLRGADCWGWATWRRGWALFNPNGRDLLHQLQEQQLTRRFDFNGTYPYTQMLMDQIAGKNDAWDIRWYASAFLANKLTLYPGRSLVHNIGNDGSGVHGVQSSFLDTVPSPEPIRVERLPLVESEQVRQQIEQFLARQVHTPSLPRRLYRWLKQRLTVTR